LTFEAKGKQIMHGLLKKSNAIRILFPTTLLDLVFFQHIVSSNGDPKSLFISFKV